MRTLKELGKEEMSALERGQIEVGRRLDDVGRRWKRRREGGWKDVGRMLQGCWNDVGRMYVGRGWKEVNWRPNEDVLLRI